MENNQDNYYERRIKLIDEQIKEIDSMIDDCDRAINQIDAFLVFVFALLIGFLLMILFVPADGANQQVKPKQEQIIKKSKKTIFNNKTMSYETH